MPQAPDLTPSIAPTTQGVAGPSLGVPVDAFGGAVGKALEGLGSGIEQSSDRIWARAVEMKNLNNETEAKNADAEYMKQSGIMHAEFINRMGTNAGPDALAAHIQALDNKRVEIRNGLSNDAAKRMYDGSSMSFMGRNIFNAAGHSGKQVQIASDDAALSRKELTKNSINSTPGDDIAFARGTASIKEDNRRIGDNNGWTPERRQAQDQADVSDYWLKRIIATSGDNAPGAQKMLDTAVKTGALTDNDADKARVKVEGEFLQQGSRIISQSVLASRRSGDEENRPAQEYVDAALAQAEKMRPGDAKLQDAVRRRVLTDYNQTKAVETDQDNSNVRTLGQSMLKAQMNGQPVTSFEQLKSLDPGNGPALDAIMRDPRKVQSFQKQFDQNARGEKISPNAENIKEFNVWRDISRNGTDEEKAKFMAQPFANQESMTYGQRNTLLDMQSKLKYNAKVSADADPRVARAMGMLRGDLEAAGITARGTDEQKKDFYAFRATLQDQLENYQQANPGKLIKSEEITALGAQLMKEQNTHWWQSSQKFYQTEAPDAEATAIKSDPMWAQKGIVPSDYMVNRIYRAQQFSKRYGGSGKSLGADQ